MRRLAQACSRPAERTRIGQSQLSRKFDDALFARFQHARAGDARRDAGGSHAFQRRPQAVEIEIVERDAGGAQVERGVQLLRRADQQMQLRAAETVRQRRAAQMAGRVGMRPVARECLRHRPVRCTCKRSTASRRNWFSSERARTASLRLRAPLPPIRTACCPGGRIARADTPESIARFCAGAQRRLRELHRHAGLRATRPFGHRAARPRARPHARRPAACARAPPHPGNGRASLSRSGIVRAPHQVAGPDARGIHRAVAEAQLAACRARRPTSKHAAAFFRLLGTAPVGGIEHHAVAGLERSDRVRLGRLDDHAVRRCTRVTRPISTPRCRGARPSPPPDGSCR